MYVNNLLRVREKPLFPPSKYQKHKIPNYISVGNTPNPNKDLDYIKPRPRRLPPLTSANISTNLPLVYDPIPSRNESLQIVSSEDESSDEFYMNLVPKFCN